MKLNIFRVAGSALNFGGRRMETIARLAWLPVILTLVLQFVGVYLYLSVAAGRLITGADFAYAAAQQQLGKILLVVWMAKPVAMGIATAAVAFFNLLLISSFMAPLIRYAGLGEKPERGAMRLDFGPHQRRYAAAVVASLLVMAAFVYLPIASTAYYTMKYVSEALNETLYASFPDPESLHTIEIKSRGEALAESSKLEVFMSSHALAVAAPFALLWWAALIAHFHPKNRNAPPGRPNVLARAAAALIGGLCILGVFWLAGAGYAGLMAAAGDAAIFRKGLGGIFEAGLARAMQYWPYFSIAALALAIFYHLNLRLTPWPGVAVCRGTMAPGGMLRVTRGWNILRLVAILAVIAVIVFLLQIALNGVAMPALGWTFGYIWAATDSASKISNGGETARWIVPFFTWVWSLLMIAVNLFWTFFTYGVTAGLLGRLYRETEGAA